MSIPEPAKKRLIQLARLLSQLQDKTITSVRIQKLMLWTNVTVRKDISYILAKCPVKSASNGYNRDNLLSAINSVLNLSLKSAQDKKKCCIVGLGKIGQALIEHNGLENSAFLLQAGFDASVNRVETLNAPFPLYGLNQLESIICAEYIQYALLAVDDKDACKTAKRLAQSGIQGIVNYTAAVLLVAKTTKVENVSVIDVLQNLAH